MEVLKKSLGIGSVDEELKIVKAVRCLSLFVSHAFTHTHSLACSIVGSFAQIPLEPAYDDKRAFFVSHASVYGQTKAGPVDPRFISCLVQSNVALTE